MSDYSLKISEKLNIRVQQISATQKLLEEGATVPFISRYRKEVTGSLDEVQVTQIRDLLIKLKELDQRRETILKTIEEQGKLSLRNHYNARYKDHKVSDTPTALDLDFSNFCNFSFWEWSDRSYFNKTNI